MHDIASIEKILNLNQEKRETGGDASLSSPILNDDGEPIWKVLVFDNLGRDVISSVLRVQDLRNFGVTIHLYVCNWALKYFLVWVYIESNVGEGHRG